MTELVRSPPPDPSPARGGGSRSSLSPELNSFRRTYYRDIVRSPTAAPGLNDGDQNDRHHCPRRNRPHRLDPASGECPSPHHRRGRARARRRAPRSALAGRRPRRPRLAPVPRAHTLADRPTDPDAALGNAAYAIFFDAAPTHQRAAVLERAIAAGKHVYCEKPVAPTVEAARALLRQAQARGVKHGVV